MPKRLDWVLSCRETKLFDLISSIPYLAKFRGYFRKDVEILIFRPQLPSKTSDRSLVVAQSAWELVLTLGKGSAPVWLGLPTRDPPGVDRPCRPYLEVFDNLYP